MKFEYCLPQRHYVGANDVGANRTTTKINVGKGELH